MALKLGELIAYLKIDKKDFDKDLVAAQVEMRAAGKKMGNDADSAGKKIGYNLGREIERLQQRMRALAHEFAQTGDKGLLSKIADTKSELGQLQNVAKMLGEEGTGWLSRFGNAMGSLGEAGQVLGPMVQTIAMVAAVTVGLGLAISVAVPIIGAFAGALASIPALAAGGAAGIGVLALGFSGLADHFKKTTRAGGGFVDKAYQIVQAERRLRDANEEATDAQKALTQARADAAEQLDDLNRSLASARLDQRSAVMAVADAQRQLEAAQQSGNEDQIARAQLAYDQAVQSLADVRDRVEDLAKEQQKAARAGVEGSAQVVAAKKRERAAVESVEDAEHALQQARRSGNGGGGAAQQLERIAPAAQAVVDKLKALKPAWDNLRLDVQQKLFSGVSGKIQKLADAWLPTLHAKLGDTATAFNHAFGKFADTASKPGFVDKVGKGLDSVNKLIDKVGQAAAGPLADALADLAEAAQPFIDALGDGLSDAIKDFADWIKQAKDSGRLEKFFDKATQFLKDLGHVGKTALGIVGDILAALFGKQQHPGKTGWQSFMDTLDDLKTWLDNPENQRKIKQFAEKLEAVGAAFLKVSGKIAEFLVWLHTMDEKTHILLLNIEKKIATFVLNAKEKWDKLVDFVKGLPARVGKAAEGMFDGIKDAFKAALNWIIDKWNALEFKLPGFDAFGAHIGGSTIKMPPISRLAAGGVVPATPGGRLAQIGEGGEAEAVAPLSKLAGMIRDAVSSAMRDSGGEMTATIPVDLGEGIQQVFEVKLRKSTAATGRRVRAAYAGRRG